MANKRYTKGYKLVAVKLALSGEKSQTQVARDLGLNEQTLYYWISHYRGEVLESDHCPPSAPCGPNSLVNKKGLTSI